LEPKIVLGDTIYEVPSSDRFDCILTNPPFGTKGANQAPDREDFTIATSNKQLNFIQHVMSILRPGGRAAIVVPDNCLFADQAGEVFKILAEDCNLHTVLRLPRGTFTPYSQGVKANVVFFTKGDPTEAVWIYDARSNVPGITKKDRPLTDVHFAKFERCYGADPDGRAKRRPKDSPPDKGYLGGDRWRSFTIAEVEERDFKLDSFKWLKDESLEDADELPPPEELTNDAISELEGAVEELNAVLALLENGNGANTRSEIRNPKSETNSNNKNSNGRNGRRGRGQEGVRRPDCHQRPDPEHGPRGSRPAGDARFRSGPALRRDHQTIERASRPQPQSVPGRFCISADTARVYVFDVANCDFKARPGWTPEAPVGVHRTRRRHAFQRPELSHGRAGEHRDHAGFRPTPPLDGHAGRVGRATSPAGRNRPTA